MGAEEFELTGGRSESSPCSDTSSRYGASHDPICRPVNWVLFVGLLGCLSFWGAVVLGVVAAV
jgi:hypothetical protein